MAGRPLPGGAAPSPAGPGAGLRGGTASPVCTTAAPKLPSSCQRKKLPRSLSKDELGSERPPGPLQEPPREPGGRAPPATSNPDPSPPVPAVQRGGGPCPLWTPAQQEEKCHQFNGSSMWPFLPAFPSFGVMGLLPASPQRRQINNPDVSVCRASEDTSAPLVTPQPGHWMRGPRFTAPDTGRGVPVPPSPGGGDLSKARRSLPFAAQCLLCALG